MSIVETATLRLRRPLSYGLTGILLGILSSLVLAPRLAAQTFVAGEGIFAFENVTVIPMDSERTLPEQTVLVRDGRIAEISPTGEVGIPPEAVRIDGAGRYLLPGLSDMSTRLPGEDDPLRVVVLNDILLLHLANGVTTIRVVAGAPYQQKLKDDVTAGRTVGPTLYISGPRLDQNSAPNPEAGRAITRSESEGEWDFLSLDSTLSSETWYAIARDASEMTKPFGGRLPASVDIRSAIGAGVSSLDGLDGFLEVTRREGLASNAAPAELFAATDMEALARLAEEMSSTSIYLVPTQHLQNVLYGWNEGLGGWVPPDTVSGQPEFRHVPQAQRDMWTTTAWNRWVAPNVTPESAAAYGTWRKQLLSALHEAGAKILLGTGAADLLSVPGSSIHREIGLMLGAGMTPFEILTSATRLPAEYVAEILGQDGDFGTIEVGKRADLLLLDANPLTTIATLQAPRGVMNNGHWIAQEDIVQELAAMADRYKDPEVD